MTRRDFLPLLGAGSIGAAAWGQRRRQPNFVVLFADDMAYGDLACYGHPNLRTPHIDRMAAEGMRFTNWYSAAPVCTPSRVGLLTGRNPIRAGQPNNTGPDTVGGLPLTEILLPQVLKKRGYRTMAVGKWHLGYKPVAQLPTSRGFDQYFGLPYSNDMIPPWVKTTQPLHLYRNEEPVETVGEQGMLTERYTDAAVRFIKESGERPFFLYVPYAMPHLPVSASARFQGRSRAGLYGDVIEALDWSVGEILRTLQETGQDGNTMVVFTSDNGFAPSVGVADLERRGHFPSGPLRGYKSDVWEGGHRVPFIVRYPAVVRPGGVCDALVHQADLMATLADVLNATLPVNAAEDSVSLLPLLRGGTDPVRRHAVSCSIRGLPSFRDGRWKLIFGKGSGGWSRG